MWLILMAVLVITNAAAFIAYGLDKRKAGKGQWRTRERTLLWMAALFGAAGAYAGMRIFHHKTRKRPFTWLVPLMLIIQIAVIALLLWKKLI